MSKRTDIRTSYPAEVIDNFITWLGDHGYKYEEVFMSSLETQQYYFSRFLSDNPENQQLKLFPD